MLLVIFLSTLLVSTPKKADALGPFVYQVNNGNGWWVLVKGWDYRYVTDWYTYFKLLANDPDRLRVVHTVPSQYNVTEWTQRITRDAGWFCPDEDGAVCPETLDFEVAIYVNGSFWKYQHAYFSNPNGGDQTFSFAYPGRINSLGYEIAGFGSFQAYFRETNFYVGDQTPPTNPTSVTEKGSAGGTSYTASGSWQNWRNDPYFVWSGASDAMTGVNGYFVYWGGEESGTSTSYQTSNVSDPGAVAGSGTYYLRVATKDNATNVAAWTTLYKFRYDAIAPSVSVTTNPSGWTNTTTTLTASATDSQSGVAAVYCRMEGEGWSSGLTCSRTTGVANAIFYYYAVDFSNNSSGIKTQTVTNIDKESPTFPSSIAITGTGCKDYDTIHNKWQNVCAGPTLTWSGALDSGSGIAGYRYYWGTSPTGTATTYTTNNYLAVQNVASESVYYLNVQTVDRAGNSSEWRNLFILKYDLTPPTLPSSAKEITYGDSDPYHVVSDTAQTKVADPSFTWSASTDGGAGVKGYYVYFGSDAHGVDTEFTVEPAWNPAYTRPGTYYLRVRSVDITGNQSVDPSSDGWTTLFIFKYVEPVGAPKNTTVSNGSVVNGSCQAAVSSPIFTWTAPTLSAGYTVDSYRVYFGSSITGESTYSTTNPSYSTSLLTDGVYYLRVKTITTPSLATDWTTVFTFCYDATAPAMPTPVVDLTGSSNNVWQATIKNPYFRWPTAVDNVSGVDSYYVYFGADSGGTSSSKSANNGREPYYDAPAITNSGTYYFRLKVTDKAGNTSDWDTVYTFKFDNTVPVLASYRATDMNGSHDKVWQNTTADPNFRWELASDEHSDLDNAANIKYDVHFGVDPSGGIPINPTPLANPTHDVPAVSESGKYYLRLRAIDSMGNISAWKTAYEFYYDNKPPDLPEAAVESGRVLNATWTSRRTPSFTWEEALDYGAGVRTYYIYFGPDSAFSSTALAYSSTSTAYSPSQLTNTGIYYLRVQAEDNLGNRSDWKTLFEYWLDATPPINPVQYLEVTNNVQSDTWNRLTSNPSFDWSADLGSDGESGVSYYKVYFGTPPGGTSNFISDEPYYSGVVSSSGKYYLRVQTFDKAGNSSDWATAFIFAYDAVAPVNPATATEIAGSVKDSTWQSLISDPEFVWSTSNTDAGAGLEKWCVYFGTQVDGKDASNCLSRSYFLSYNPPALTAPGEYYLRVSAVDTIGNAAAWSTIFRLRYDNVDPTAPTTGIDGNGVLSDTWTALKDPYFTWEAGTDTLSGVAGYNYYFGNDPGGTANNFRSTPDVDPRALTETGKYYLRAQSKDRAGNYSEWKTVFTYAYDGTAPSEPSGATEVHGITSGTWQNMVTEPEFNWIPSTDAESGQKEYYVYFGPSSIGTSTNKVTEPHLKPAPPLSDPSGVYYLRAAAIDNVGNVTVWKTLFVWLTGASDSTPPLPPTSATEISKGIKSRVWQSSTNAPEFTWSTSNTDGQSGVDKYCIYFGLDAEGTDLNNCLLRSTFSFFAPEPVNTSGEYFLRISAVDISGNASYWSTVFRFYYDNTPPTNPTTVTSSSGIASEEWNSFKYPGFTWSGAVDNNAGVSGYYVYFGTDPGGISTNFKTVAMYDPPQVSNPGLYYFRIQTKDNAGNLSDWKTVFIYAYDGLSPSEPSDAMELGGTASTVWQNAVNAPRFQWDPSTDSQCGMKGYYVYFGASKSGVSTSNLVLTPDYSVTADVVNQVPNGVNYLRAASVDKCDNVSSWVTLFTFKYDKTAPKNPTTVVEENGVAADSWTNLTKKYKFTWSGQNDIQSGVDGFQLYFGPDPLGTSSVYTSTAVYSPTEISGLGRYYFRMRTRDQVGNYADWETMFELGYDNITPSAPDHAVETHNIGQETWTQQAAPTFTWTGATDNLSGVSGYRVYLGTDPEGLSASSFRPDASYSPDSLTKPGTYYLRVSSVDVTGNTSNYVTLFTYLFDNTGPINPTQASSTNGLINGKCQYTVPAPAFAWNAAEDPQSGVKGYQVYLGTDPAGSTQTAFVTSSSYASTTIPYGIYYFRVKSVDQLDNAAPDWATLFTVCYVDVSDINPTTPNLNVAWSPADTVVDGCHTTRPTISIAGGGVVVGFDALKQYFIEAWSTDAANAQSSLENTNLLPADAPTWHPSYAPGKYMLKATSVVDIGTVGNLVDFYSLPNVQEFCFDDTAPATPDSVKFGSADAGTWTNQVSATASWNAISDFPAGFDHNLACFGTSPCSPTTTVTNNQLPISVGADGEYRLRLLSVDKFGNKSVAKDYFYRLDRTAPILTITTAPQKMVNQFSFSWNGTDMLSGILEYRFLISDGSTESKYTAPATSSTWSSGTLQIDDGPYMVSMSAVDKAGNTATSQVYLVTYDKTAPVLSNGTVAWDYSKSPNFTTGVIATDSHSIAAYQWRVVGKDLTATTIVPAWTIDIPNGEYDFEARAEDVAGNWSSWLSLGHVSADLTPPSLAAPVLATGWTNRPEFTFASDSDLYKYVVKSPAMSLNVDLFSADPYVIPFTTPGQYTVTVTACDRVGNCTTGWNYTVRFDNQAPEITLTPDQTGTWVSSDLVSIGVLASDNISVSEKIALKYSVNNSVEKAISGASPKALCPITSGGQYKVRVTATDEAGNVAEETYTVQADKTLPVISLLRTNGSVWQKQTDTPSFSWEITEADSGIDKYLVNYITTPGGQSGQVKSTTINGDINTFSLPAFTGEWEGRVEVMLRAVDKAGNTGLWVPTIYYQDSKAPSIIFDTRVSSSDWQREYPVAFGNLMATDKGSGLSSILYCVGEETCIPHNVAANGGAVDITGIDSQEVYLRVAVTDIVGNTTTQTLYALRYSSNPPRADIANVPTQTRNSSIALAVKTYDIAYQNIYVSMMSPEMTEINRCTNVTAGCNFSFPKSSGLYTFALVGIDPNGLRLTKNYSVNYVYSGSGTALDKKVYLPSVVR
ncbi:MAG: Ig-like domain repeat protein [Bacteroidales bacterium]